MDCIAPLVIQCESRKDRLSVSRQRIRIPGQRCLMDISLDRRKALSLTGIILTDDTMDSTVPSISPDDPSAQRTEKSGRIKRSMLAAVLVSSLGSINAYAAPQQPAAIAPDLTKVDLNGETLRLVESQGQCAVQRADQSTLTTDVSWPCFFSKTWARGDDRNMKPIPRIEKFNDIPIVIVMNIKRPSLPIEDCVSNLQAVRLRSGVLEKSVTMVGRSCDLNAGDQKVFVGLFGDW